MNTMSGNEVQTILPTSPTAKELQFICIILKNYDFYYVQLLFKYYGPHDPAHLSVTMSHTQQEA